MNEVRLAPRQAPARAELLLAADFGRQAQAARSTAGSRAGTAAASPGRG